MTDTNNGWLGKPGVPLNPEKDGWHWVSFLGDRHPQIIEWFSDAMGWDGGWTTEDFGQHFRYHGPVLDPDEATALQARVAELEKAQARLILSFRLNILRLNPKLSHETISKAIDAALEGGKKDE